MAWPERIILIIVVAVSVLALEMTVLIVCKEYHVSGWLVGPGVLAALFGDIWGALRTIDWLMAGPARRRGERIVKFSP